MEIKNYEKSGLERAISRSQAKDITLDYQKIEKEQEKSREYTREADQGAICKFPDGGRFAQREHVAHCPESHKLFGSRPPGNARSYQVGRSMPCLYYADFLVQQYARP